VAHRCDNDRHPSVGRVLGHLKRTLEECRQQVERLEEMLLKSSMKTDRLK